MSLEAARLWTFEAMPLKGVDQLIHSMTSRGMISMTSVSATFAVGDRKFMQAHCAQLCSGADAGSMKPL